MNQIHSNNPFKDLYPRLKIDCDNCCGLCCVALYYSKSEGFPKNKEAGTPCPNLTTDFRCRIHSHLQKRGLKGCTAYDCFGAGQKVSQVIYPNADWRKMKKNEANQMFSVFFKVYQLQQMLWYLVEAASLSTAQTSQIRNLILENQNLTECSPDKIQKFDLDGYRLKVNRALRSAAEETCKAEGRKIEKVRQTRDYIGRDFKAADLSGKDFSMALLIAADLSGCKLRGSNFLGADLRDANLQNADLGESIFLTQMQINEAKGSRRTKLPQWLDMPEHWC